jgi:ankyrin repeat protein
MKIMHFNKLAIELIESGIDITYQNKKGLNALMYAIVEKQTDLVQALINHKDVKSLLRQVDQEGNNVLIYSLNRDDKTFVRNTAILSTLLKNFEFSQEDVQKALQFSYDIKHFRAQEILKEYLQKPQNDAQINCSQPKKLVA